jgi:hypothetical protein
MMKRFILNTTMAVAALAVAAGTVSAQTMRAEIPFAFRVGNQVMQPGQYRVALVQNGSGVPLLSVANIGDRRSVLLMALYQNDVPKGWAAAGLPKLSFACGEGFCTVNRAWVGEGPALTFGSTRGKNGEPHIAEIVLRPERGE